MIFQYKKLYQYRTEKGLTQKQVADIIGTSTQQWQKYERALNNISAVRLPKVAEALGVKIMDFYEESLDDTPPVDTRKQRQIRKIASGIEKIKSVALRNMILDCVNSCIQAEQENKN